jgi:hypothetical protein
VNFLMENRRPYLRRFEPSTWVTVHDQSALRGRSGPGRTGCNTDLVPNRAYISRRLEDTHSESPEARPEVRTRPRVCDSQGLA